MFLKFTEIETYPLGLGKGFDVVYSSVFTHACSPALKGAFFTQMFLLGHVFKIHRSRNLPFRDRERFRLFYSDGFTHACSPALKRAFCTHTFLLRHVFKIHRSRNLPFRARKVSALFTPAFILMRVPQP
jgi:hypothetical protein